MRRFIILALFLLATPAHATMMQFDISAIARSDSAAFGVASGDTLRGSITLDGSVSRGKGRTSNVDSFEFRVGNTVFDMIGGTFKASYKIVDDALTKLGITAKPKEFDGDFRYFALKLVPAKTTLKIRDIDRKWLQITDIRIDRTLPEVPFATFGTFNLTTANVAEPSSLAMILAAGLLLLLACCRRLATTTQKYR